MYAIRSYYAIGVAKPVGVYINTYGTARVKMDDGQIANEVKELFDLRPAAIEAQLKLRNPIYRETAAYGHMGRTPRTVVKVFESPYWGRVEKKVELFTWEKLDYVAQIKDCFGV